jgi:hypothetical protein
VLGIDPIAGAEAVISHLDTREIGVPCAHASALPPLNADSSVAPKSAAEELGYTFLSCVLVGFSAAPQLIPLDDMAATAQSHGGLLPGLVTVEDVNAVVVPADAIGGAAVMSLAARPDVPVVAVKANTTSMTVPPQAAGIHLPECCTLYASRRPPYSWRRTRPESTSQPWERRSPVCKDSVMSPPFRLSVGRDTDD